MNWTQSFKTFGHTFKGGALFVFLVGTIGAIPMISEKIADTADDHLDNLVNGMAMTSEHKMAAQKSNVTMNMRHGSLTEAINKMCQYEADNSSSNNELVAECIEETTENILVLKR